VKGNGNKAGAGTAAAKARRPPQRDPRALAGCKPAVENPGENPGGAVPRREQGHGGALRTGGTNRGGPGRPTNAVREVARLRYEERIPVLCDIADAKLTRGPWPPKQVPCKKSPAAATESWRSPSWARWASGRGSSLRSRLAARSRSGVMVGPELLAEQPNLAVDCPTAGLVR
jgi:hypothetical protein